jgi:hypothetical protein
MSESDADAKGRLRKLAEIVLQQQNEVETLMLRVLPPNVDGLPVY